MLYALEPRPYKATKTEMQALGYLHPHAFSYILHPIKKCLSTFHIDLPPLLRVVNHTGDNTYGTPLYLSGIQLRRFMAEEPQKSKVEESSQHCFSTSSQPISSRSNQGAPWTQEQEEKLLSLLNQHFAVKDIATQMGRTEKAIVRRMGCLRKVEIIPFALYIHYYDNDSAFASRRNDKHLH